MVPTVPVSCQSKQNLWRNKYFTHFFKYKNSCTIFNSMSFAPKNMILILLEPEFYLLQGSILITSACCVYIGFLNWKVFIAMHLHNWYVGLKSRSQNEQ